MKKRKTILTVLLSVCLLSSMALANGLNLNSLGTKALTMGGAFVGLADDFSAIYWNPAGIAQFDRKYIGFYGTDIIPSGSYTMTVVDPVFGPITVVNAETQFTHYLSGMAAYYHPLSDRLVFGLGVYIPSGLGASWNGADFANISMGETYDWMSKVGIITFAPALAVKVNEKLYLGAALNVNYGMFDIAMHAGAVANPAPPPDEVDLGQYEESMTGWGYGATFGVLLRLSEMFSLGATFRTQSTVKFSGEASISNLSFLGWSDTSKVEREVTWPVWLAGGAAFKPMENLTLTADVQWTQWSKIDVMETTFVDPVWAAMMEASGDDKRPLHWKDALQIRFGAEYRTKSIVLRGGYYWDPSQAPDRTMNVLLPSYDFHVATLGFGYSLNGIHLDFGIEYLMGKERTVPLERVLTDPEWESAMPGDYTMKIIVPTLSIGYRF